MKILGEITPFIALLASWIAMTGSLYMSEMLRWPPCALCWTQRAFMYPMSFLLPVAIYNHSLRLAKLAFGMSIIGGSIAFYHYMEVMHIFPPTPCTVINSVSCTHDLLMISLQSSWLAIPLLSLIAFKIIGVSMFIVQKSQVWDEENHPST